MMHIRYMYVMIHYMTLGAEQTCYFKICGRYKKPAHLLKNKMLRRKPNCQGDTMRIWCSMPLAEKDPRI